MRIVVTGAAGFIGFHTVQQLLACAEAEIVGIDNLNGYYPVQLKLARLKLLADSPRFRFVKLDFSEWEPLAHLLDEFPPDYVVHLGAQAGVRYSLENPQAYVVSNITGFLNILEACRRHQPQHLLYASSSSVYGDGTRLPFDEGQAADRPLSFYAATKRSNELMAHSYSHLYGLNTTGIRIFTAYGPWGRPDMSPVHFARAIRSGQPIELFNFGNNWRDFTFVDDVVAGIIGLLFDVGHRAGAGACEVFNLGHDSPVRMSEFVELLARFLGRPAKVKLLPPQPGDVVRTCADLTRIRQAISYTPRIALAEGLERFVEWFDEHEHLTREPEHLPQVMRTS